MWDQVGKQEQEQEQEREAEAEAAAAVRCGRCSRSEAVVLIVEISVNRQKRQSTVTREEKSTTMRGYQKKMSEDGAFDTRLRDDGGGSKGQTGEVRF